MINLELNKEIVEKYQNAKPFPHIVIDNFLPETILNSVLEEYNKNNNWMYDKVKWTEPYQVNKFYWPHDIDSAKNLSKDLPTISALVNYLNSPVFLNYLEELTGIKRLIGDDLLMGGGLHKTTNGGKLAIHKDYNIHPVKKNYRRLNLLIYLNKVWEPEWGGSLELWNNDMTNKDIEVLPIFNRAVIFTIGKDSYHGHPNPINAPADIARKSIALYYFTEEKPKDEGEHPVMFFETN